MRCAGGGPQLGDAADEEAGVEAAADYGWARFDYVGVAWRRLGRQRSGAKRSAGLGIGSSHVLVGHRGAYALLVSLLPLQRW